MLRRSAGQARDRDGRHGLPGATESPGAVRAGPGRGHAGRRHLSRLLREVLFQHRNYFGVVRVTHDSSVNDNELIHGHTLHGTQSLDPARRREPLTYYFRTGPIGQVIETLHERLERANIAIVGLGAGTMAAYGEPGQHWVFYDIDPVVEKICATPGSSRIWATVARARSTWFWATPGCGFETRLSTGTG